MQLSLRLYDVHNGGFLIESDSDDAIRVLRSSFYKMLGNRFDWIRDAWYTKIKNALCLYCSSRSQGSHSIPESIQKVLAPTKDKRVLPITRMPHPNVKLYSIGAALDLPFETQPISKVSKFYALCNVHDNINTEYEAAWENESEYFKFSPYHLAALAGKSILSVTESYQLMHLIASHDEIVGKTDTQSLDALKDLGSLHESKAVQLVSGTLTSRLIFECRVNFAIAANQACYRILKNKSLHYVVSIFPTYGRYSRMIVHSWDPFTILYLERKVRSLSEEQLVFHFLGEVLFNPSALFVLPQWSHVLEYKLLNRGLRGLDRRNIYNGNSILGPRIIEDLLSYIEPKFRYDFALEGKSCLAIYESKIRTPELERSLQLRYASSITRNQNSVAEGLSLRNSLREAIKEQESKDKLVLGTDITSD